MASFDDDDDDKAQSPAVNNPWAVGGWAASKKIIEPRCHVCKSKYRDQIDHEILLGHSHTAIAKKYQEEYGDSSITRASVINHYTRHLTVEDAAIRRIIEQRYQEENENVAEAVGIMLGQRSVLEVLAYKGYKSVISGETIVEVKDLLTILKDMRQMDGSMIDVEKEEMNRDFRNFTQSVKEIVPTAMWEEIADRFNDKTENAKPKMLSQLVDMDSLRDIDDPLDGEIV